MTNDSKTDMRETHLLGAAGELAGMLYRWNVIDEYDLVIENSATGTPYHHVTTALEKILVLVGLTPDEKMGFYDMVTTGMTPFEAKQRLLDHRPAPDAGDDEC